jgi:hypothetical protein
MTVVYRPADRKTRAEREVVDRGTGPAGGDEAM